MRACRRLRRAMPHGRRDWPYAPATLCSLYGGVNWDDPAYGNGTKGIDVVHKQVKKEYLRRRSRRPFPRPTAHHGHEEVGHSVAA